MISNMQVNQYEEVCCWIAKEEEMLEEEGHTVVKKGKKYVVVDFEKHLVQP